MRSRRLIVILLCGLVVLVGGLAGYWFWSADRLEREIALWTQDQRARGYDIDYRGPDVSGFPLWLQAHFAKPRVASPEGWHWAGPAIRAEAPLWDPREIVLRFPGLQRFVRGSGPAQAETELEANRAEARVWLGNDGRIARGTTAMAQVTLRPPAQPPVEVESLEVEAGPLRPANGDRLEELDWAVKALGIELPETIQTPLGPSVAQLRADATLSGRLPADEARAALARWRDGGGKLDVTQLVLVWGPLDLDAEGTITLDQQMRPLGAFTARVGGLSETLRAFAKDGLIEPGQAVAIELILLTLAGETGPDGRRRVVVPITLQDGQLFLGPVPLIRLDPVL